MSWRAAAPALALLVAVLGGCGGDGGGSGGGAKGSSSAQRLTTSDRRLIDDSERAIDLYCRRQALGLVEPRKQPTVGQHARAFEAVDALVELARDKPRARVRRGEDVELFVSDLAENLDGSNCDPAVVSRLNQGLAGAEPAG